MSKKYKKNKINNKVDKVDLAPLGTPVNLPAFIILLFLSILFECQKYSILLHVHMCTGFCVLMCTAVLFWKLPKYEFDNRPSEFSSYYFLNFFFISFFLSLFFWVILRSLSLSHFDFSLFSEILLILLLYSEQKNYCTHFVGEYNLN